MRNRIHKYYEVYRRLARHSPRAQNKKVFGHFLLLDGSIWTETMLYDQGISLPYGRSAARFPATGPDFGPKIRFFAIGPRILSMARL